MRFYSVVDWRKQMFFFTNLSNKYLQEHFRVTAGQTTKAALPPPNFRDLNKWIKHT